MVKSTPIEYTQLDSDLVVPKFSDREHEGNTNGIDTQEIYIALGLDQNTDGSYSEYMRAAFESKEDCREYIKHELHGGRICPIQYNMQKREGER